MNCVGKVFALYSYHYHMKKLLVITGVLLLLLITATTGLLLYVQANQQILTAQMQQRFNQSVKGHLQIGSLQLNVFKNFPHLSLSVNDISVKDSVYGKEIFKGGHVYLQMSLLQLFRKQLDFSSILVDGGSVFLIRDSTGYQNTDILRTGNSGGNMGIDIKQVEIRRLTFVQRDDIIGQLIAFNLPMVKGTRARVNNTDVLHLTGTMDIDSMVFKKDKGAFFKHQQAGLDVNIDFDNSNSRVVIKPSKFEMNGQVYDGSGYFDYSVQPGILSLQFTNPKTNFNSARAILSDMIKGYLKDAVLNDPVDVKVVVLGPVIPGMPPKVDAMFNLNNANLKFGGVKFSNLTLKGHFTNHVTEGVKNDDANSALYFDVPAVKIEGVPASVNVSVVNLVALKLTLAANAHTPLATINGALPKGGYKFTDGDLDVSLQYKGVMSAYMPGNRQRGADTLSGYLRIKNGGFAYAVRDIKLTAINTDITFNQLKVQVNDMSAMLNDNPVVLKGYLDGVSRLISNKNQKMTGYLTLDAPDFNLSKVLTEKNIAQLSAAPVTLSAEESDAAAEAIDKLLDDVTLRLQFTSNRFVFRRFNARNVAGDVTVSAKGMQLQNFKLNTCKGTVLVNGGLQTGRRRDYITGNVLIKNVDVKEFMRSADNFEQTAITADNLSGNLSATLGFNAPIDTNYAPLTDSMQGSIYFSLKGARITNFEPLADVNKYIFKNRDFKNVTFDEIKDSVTLNGMNLTIQRMEVASNVLRMFIQGTYRINGIADVTIQVPLNNFKKQDLNYTPTNMGVDAKTGASLFLRVKGGGKEKVKISLDAGARQRLKKDGLM